MLAIAFAHTKHKEGERERVRIRRENTFKWKSAQKANSSKYLTERKSVGYIFYSN